MVTILHTPGTEVMAMVPISDPAFALLAPIDHTGDPEPHFLALLAERGAPDGYTSPVPDVASMTLVRVA